MPTVTTFSAPDIHCGGCAASIRKALTQTAGIGDVTVDLSTKTVIVTHDAPVATVAAVLEETGFPSTVKSAE